MSDTESSTSLPENVVAGIAYLFLWVSGAIVFVIEERSKYVKRHAAQSVVVFGLLTGLMFLSWVFSFLPVFGLMFSWAQSLLSMICALLWIVMLYFAFTGESWVVPGFEAWVDYLVRRDVSSPF